MNALQKALANLHYTIPKEILYETFVSNENTYRDDGISIDDRILNTVIRPRIYIDTNLVGGNMVFLYIGDRRFH